VCAVLDHVEVHAVEHPLEAMRPGTVDGRKVSGWSRVEVI